MTVETTGAVAEHATTTEEEADIAAETMRGATWIGGMILYLGLPRSCLSGPDSSHSGMILGHHCSECCVWSNDGGYQD